MVGVTWQEKRNGWIGVEAQAVLVADLLGLLVGGVEAEVVVTDRGQEVGGVVGNDAAHAEHLGFASRVRRILRTLRPSPVDVPERSDAVAVQLAWYEGELALHVRTDEWAVLTKRTALDVAASVIRLASQMPD
ncbi:hypothetical protein GCM10027599_26550 [Yimella radicis]